MVAVVRAILAFVHIDAGSCVVAPLETLLAFARVRPGRVDAVGVDGAHFAGETRALVDVFALSQEVHAESQGALALVASGSVLARLVIATFVRFRGALVDVNALVSLKIGLVSGRTAEQALALVGAHGVDASVVATTEAPVARALVDVCAVSEDVAGEAGSAVSGQAATVLLELTAAGA